MTVLSRPKVGDGLVMAVAHRLTERDRQILTMLYRHRVFTTDQLAEMYFEHTNTAQHRLTTLYKLRLVDRFQPLDHRYASLPYHYVLDELVPRQATFARIEIARSFSLSLCRLRQAM